jgi:hypothetical protein
MAKDYDIGYGKPPQHTQFPKGRSGNPAGRPKGARSLEEELKRLLATKTKIKLNGTIKTVPAVRALGIVLIQKAMAGDVRALSKIVEIVGPDMADGLKSLSTAVRETDIGILKRAWKRDSQLNLNAQEPTDASKEDKT